MTFKEAIAVWYDSDGLIANIPNPTTCGTEGNPVLETATAYLFRRMLGEAAHEDVARYFSAITAIEKWPGLPNKKMRLPDEVAHDDMIGYVASSLVLARRACAYGAKNRWVFSNTGNFYWDAWAKPWHQAFYRLRAGYPCPLWQRVSLALAIAASAYFKMDAASGKRLTYLMVQTIGGKSCIVDCAIFLWWHRINKVYGGARRIFIMLKGEKHPFSVYCPD